MTWGGEARTATAPSADPPARALADGASAYHPRGIDDAAAKASICPEARVLVNEAKDTTSPEASVTPPSWGTEAAHPLFALRRSADAAHQLLSCSGDTDVAHLPPDFRRSTDVA